jgi:hypothetical protein
VHALKLLAASFPVDTVRIDSHEVLFPGMKVNVRLLFLLFLLLISFFFLFRLPPTHEHVELELEVIRAITVPQN